MNPIVLDAPGETMAERLGFTRQWFLTRAKGWLETSRACRINGARRAAALHLNFAGECRRDAANIGRVA